LQGSDHLTPHPHVQEAKALFGDRWLRCAFWLALLLALVSYPLQSADAARTAAWPANWTNPSTGETGGSVTVTANWGVFSLGCKGVRASPEHEFYLRTGTKQHLGIDLRAPVGQNIYAIGRGKVVRSGKLWDTDNVDQGGVMIVEHYASTGERFTVVYGHINIGISPDTKVQWKADDKVHPGDLLGNSYPLNQPHLHFGIAPGQRNHLHGAADANVKEDGACEDSDRLAKRELNEYTVDPILFLNKFKAFQGPNACSTFNLVSNLTNTPFGYGLPFNIFARDQKLLFEAICRGGDTVEVLAGHNYATQYSYRNGYRWTGQRWERFTFTGPERRGDWLIGRAVAEFAREDLNAAGSNWIVGFSCWLLASGQWRCGCTNAACSESRWQAQGFRLNRASASMRQ
jgi:murein DD-endopeptidase MepM/ murein hydrolase activator NlpD